MRSRHLVALALPSLLACQSGEATEAVGGDMVLDPEVPADRPIIGGTGRESDGADVAWSGSQYFAVWRQDGFGYPAGYAVRGTRIAADGTVLDRGGIELCADHCSETPHTAAHQGGYLAVTRGYDRMHILQVGEDGSVSDLGLPEDVDFTYAPDVASAGAAALIVYNRVNEDVLQYTIRAALLDGAGFHPPVTLGSAANASRPRVAAQPGGGYLVVWQDGSDDVVGRLVEPGGGAGASVAIATGSIKAMLPDVDVAGGNFVTVWNHQGSPYEIRAATVSPAGVVSPPATVAAGFRTYEPAISCSDTCLVLWRGGADLDTNDLFGRRIGADLQPASGEAILASGDRDQGTGASAGAGGEHYLVWGDALSGVYEVRGATASDTGAGFTVGTPSLLATDRHQEHRPAIAASNTSWLVGWRDSRNGGGDIFGKRFTFDVVPKTSVAKPIHERPAIQDFVKLAWNGDRYLAAWGDDDTPGALRATRLEPDGTALDPAGITIGTGNSIRCTGVAGGSAGSWLVSWSRYATGSYRTLLTSVVAADGTRTKPVVISTTAVALAAVAHDPGTGLYLIAWKDGALGLMMAQRIAADGTPVDPAPVAVASEVSSLYGIDMVEGNGTMFLAWNASSILRGLRMRVKADGIEVLDSAPIPLLTTSADRRDIALAFVARGFLLAWQGIATSGLDYDIWGLQISTGGTVHGAPVVLADGSKNERSPALSGISQGRALLAFQRDASGERSRVYLRQLVMGYPNGTTCSDGGQCESGFCVDGRCCDSACGGGATDDCQACSVGQGAALNGMCGPVESGSLCRASADTFCDLAERCDGVALDCPADRGRRAGEVCDADCGAVCPLADESGSPHVCPLCP